MEGTITPEEIEFTRKSMETALSMGASKVRAILDKSVMDLVNTLNGEVDKVTHCMDRCLTVHLIVDGRYGSYSTNKLSPKDIEDFLRRSVETTRLLDEDPCRDLPDPSVTAGDASTGRELGTCDEDGYTSMTPSKRMELALGASILGKVEEKGFKYISEEAEYSDTVDDSIILDSQGLECRHTETSFDYAVEVTIEDPAGEKYTGWWWDAAPFAKDLNLAAICPTALRKAVANMNPEEIDGRKYNLVIDPEASSKAVSAILKALNGYNIQQHNSFLEGSLEKKLFPEGLTIYDFARQKGCYGAKLFDSEGVATSEGPIIENGVVKKYFINTYMSHKLSMAPTGEDPVRPCVLPYPRKGLDRNSIMELCGEGILVTDFNGGNSNSSTGDFSYGIEGFYFKDGKIVHPVEEMLVTGNFLKLWEGFIAAGEDYRPCNSKLIPTLAFSNVDFSA